MNKNDLIDAMVQSEVDMTKTDAGKVLNALTEAITDALRRGDKVSIPGFGTFESRHREARMGRNPSTGEQVQIKASNRPSFKAAKAFKDALN